MTDKYTKSARGKPCQIRIPGICNFDPETTVFAHINGGGMGMKRASIHGAYACSACHDAVDGRRQANFTSIALKLWHYDAMIKTQEIMIADGVLVL